jgi:hypothetical protein
MEGKFIYLYFNLESEMQFELNIKDLLMSQIVGTYFMYAGIEVISLKQKCAQ